MKASIPGEITETLIDFIEGDMEYEDWIEWRLAHETQLAENLVRRDYLGLKLRPAEYAMKILDSLGEIYIWDRTRCPICGRAIFELVIPPLRPASRDHSRAPRPYYRPIPSECPHPRLHAPRGRHWPSPEPPADEPSAFVLVEGDESLPDFNGKYTAYVDGNYVRTREPDPRPPNGELGTIEPGSHRIVVRESVVFKPDRKESPTLYFEVQEEETAEFSVSLVDGKLWLKAVD